MAIPSLIWIIVGAVIAFFSWQLGNSFTLFFYIGLAIVIIGFIKFIINYMLAEKSVVEPVRQSTHRVAVPPVLRQSYFACPRCKAQANPAANFCHYCGFRLK